MSQTLVPLAMFFLGFLTNHLYRKWYLEQPRIKIHLNKNVWVWLDRDDDEGWHWDVFCLSLSFILRNQGVPVSIRQTRIQIDGITEACQDRWTDRDILVGPAHQGSLDYEFDFGEKPREDLFLKSCPARLFLRDSLGNEYSKKFIVPPATRKK